MAIAKAGISVELREVVLRDKPRALIEASPKATVPVLVLPDGSVIEESYDILLWALGSNDPDSWLHDNHADLADMVLRNDGDFKRNLDGYKYPQKNTAKTRDEYRDDGAKWLALLDVQLHSSDFLAGDTPSALDIAVMPFIRQFAHTDLAWFESSPFQSLGNWLNFWKGSELFQSVMHKYPQWHPDDSTLVFP
jgi:glutathione S-transferase